MEQSPETRDNRADFPFWSTLMFGHFWGESSASESAKRRSRIAMLMFLIALVVASVIPGFERELRHTFVNVLVGLTLTYFAWEAWRYTTGLDELARRLYLEAFAITYLIGLAMFSVLGVLQDIAGWNISPLVFMVLEPVRLAVLAWRSRQFA